MLDASETETSEDHAILQGISDLNHLIVVNKIDKLNEDAVGRFVDAVRAETGRPDRQIVRVSAKTGEGLAELQHAIVEPFAPDDIEVSGFLVSDARHHDLLLRAKSEIEQSMELLERKTSEEIVLIGLHNSLRYLGQITGETTTEDMLTRIFSTFCIGK